MIDNKKVVRFENIRHEFHGRVILSKQRFSIQIRVFGFKYLKLKIMSRATSKLCSTQKDTGNPFFFFVA